MDELSVYMFSFCMNLMYVIRYKLYFILDCIFFYKLNTYCVVYPAVTGELSKSVATVDSSSDGWMTSACPSLLGATVVTDVFCTSLLSYHCSDELVARDHNNLRSVTIGTHRSSVGQASPVLDTPSRTFLAISCKCQLCIL
jgi:hypothetical protein